jgi:hypothetical protein
MGYLAAYNTSSFSGSLDGGPINVAISSSIFSGSTGAIRFGDIPFPPSGGMTIISDSNTQLGVASASATPLFWSVNSLTDTASILNTINTLPERVNQTRFTTTSSAYLYLVSSSKYFPILGTEPLNTIVTDGLTMYLDAGQLVSYPTTSSLWYDISGNNISGSLTNGPIYNTNGYIGFDGVDDYTNTSLLLPSPSTTPTTFNVVFSAPLSQSYKAIIGRSAYQAYGFSVGINGGGSARVTYDNSGSSYEPVFTYDSTLVSMGTFVFNGRFILIYKNGSLVNSFTASFDAVASPNPVWIANNGQGGWSYLQCNIYSAQTYNRVLTQAEINQNYYQAPIVTSGLVFAADAGNAVSYVSGSSLTYSLTGSNSGSLINGVGYSNTNGGSWNFDGIDDYITTPNVIGGFTNYSAEFWFKLNTNPTGSEKWLGNQYSGGVGRTIFDIFTTNRLRNFIDGTQITGNTPILTNTWYHAVFTRNSSGSATIYLNGVLDAIGTLSTAAVQTRAFEIGGSTVLVRWLNGQIPISRLYNKSLTATEIQQNFNAQRNRFNI